MPEEPDELVQIPISKVFASYTDHDIVQKDMQSFRLRLKVAKNEASDIIFNNPAVTSQHVTKIGLESHGLMPKEIAEWIRSNPSRNINWKGNIGQLVCDITVYPFHYMADDSNLIECLSHIISWLYICQDVSKPVCARSLSVTLYLSPFLRKMPLTNSSVRPINVNGGYATVCRNQNEIVIYRNEEWFKVFIHETIHAFGFEPKGKDEALFNKEVETIFPGARRAIRSNEAYCEMIARIWFSCYSAYSEGGENAKGTFSMRFWLVYFVELEFSRLQCASICQTQGVSSYEELGTKFKETTNAVSYFIITFLLLAQPKSLFRWLGDYTSGALRYTGGEEGIRKLSGMIRSAANQLKPASDIRVHSSARMTIIPALEKHIKKL